MRFSRAPVESPGAVFSAGAAARSGDIRAARRGWAREFALPGLVLLHYKWGSARTSRSGLSACATCGVVARDRMLVCPRGPLSGRGWEWDAPGFSGKGTICCRGCRFPRWSFQNRHQGFRNKKQARKPNVFLHAAAWLQGGVDVALWN